MKRPSSDTEDFERRVKQKTGQESKEVKPSSTSLQESNDAKFEEEVLTLDRPKYKQKSKQDSSDFAWAKEQSMHLKLIIKKYNASLFAKKLHQLIDYFVLEKIDPQLWFYMLWYNETFDENNILFTLAASKNYQMLTQLQEATTRFCAKAGFQQEFLKTNFFRMLIMPLIESSVPLENIKQIKSKFGINDETLQPSELLQFLFTVRKKETLLYRPNFCLYEKVKWLESLSGTVKPGTLKELIRTSVTDKNNITWRHFFNFINSDTSQLFSWLCEKDSDKEGIFELAVQMNSVYVSYLINNNLGPQIWTPKLAIEFGQINKYRELVTQAAAKDEKYLKLAAERESWFDLALYTPHIKRDIDRVFFLSVIAKTHPVILYKTNLNTILAAMKRMNKALDKFNPSNPDLEDLFKKIVELFELSLESCLRPDSESNKAFIIQALDLIHWEVATRKKIIQTEKILKYIIDVINKFNSGEPLLELSPFFSKQYHLEIYRYIIHYLRNSDIIPDAWILSFFIMLKSSVIPTPTSQNWLNSIINLLPTLPITKIKDKATLHFCMHYVFQLYSKERILSALKSLMEAGGSISISKDEKELKDTNKSKQQYLDNLLMKHLRSWMEYAKKKDGNYTEKDAWEITQFLLKENVNPKDQAVEDKHNYLVNAFEYIALHNHLSKNEKVSPVLFEMHIKKFLGDAMYAADMEKAIQTVKNNKLIFFNSKFHKLLELKVSKPKQPNSLDSNNALTKQFVIEKVVTAAKKLKDRYLSNYDHKGISETLTTFIYDLKETNIKKDLQTLLTQKLTSVIIDTDFLKKEIESRLKAFDEVFSLKTPPQVIPFFYLNRWEALPDLWSLPNFKTFCFFNIYSALTDPAFEKMKANVYDSSISVDFLIVAVGCAISDLRNVGLDLKEKFINTCAQLHEELIKIISINKENSIQFEPLRLTEFNQKCFNQLVAVLESNHDCVPVLGNADEASSNMMDDHTLESKPLVVQTENEVISGSQESKSQSSAQSQNLMGLFHPTPIVPANHLTNPEIPQTQHLTPENTPMEFEDNVPTIGDLTFNPGLDGFDHRT